MKETCVSKTVSLKLGQVQWLTEQYGNVTRGMQSIIGVPLVGTPPVRSSGRVSVVAWCSAGWRRRAS